MVLPWGYNLHYVPRELFAFKSNLQSRRWPSTQYSCHQIRHQKAEYTQEKSDQEIALAHTVKQPYKKHQFKTRKETSSGKEWENIIHEKIVLTEQNSHPNLVAWFKVRFWPSIYLMCTVHRNNNVMFYFVTSADEPWRLKIWRRQICADPLLVITLAEPLLVTFLILSILPEWLQCQCQVIASIIFCWSHWGIHIVDTAFLLLNSCCRNTKIIYKLERTSQHVLKHNGITIKMKCN